MKASTLKALVLPEYLAYLFISTKLLLNCPLLELSWLTEACEIFRKCNPHFELDQLAFPTRKVKVAVDTVSLVSIVLGRKGWECNLLGLYCFCFTLWSRPVSLLSGQFFLDPHFHCREPELSLEANSRHSGLPQVVPSGAWVFGDATTETRVLQAKICHIMDHLLLGP